MHLHPQQRIAACENRLERQISKKFCRDDGEKVLASNTVMLTFGLSPIKGVITVKDDGTISSQNTLIIDTFLNAAIGTLRGVLMKNLKGTQLEPFFIPLIPIEQFHSNSK